MSYRRRQVRYPVRLANGVFSWLDRLRSSHSFALSASEAIRAGEKISRFRCSCPEFGEPLEILCSASTDRQMTPIQRLQRRSEVIQRVANRLRLERALLHDSAIRAEPINSPWFIIGLPRSGTTLLHRLLAQDPAHRAPLLWEVRSPIADPSPRDLRRRINRSKRATRLLYYLAPGLHAMHHMDANLPEECDMLLDNSLIGGFWPGGSDDFYARWFALDRTRAYEIHKLQLQCLQRGSAPRTWILKSPTHLAYLDCLLKVYPDARIIQIHRHPVEALPSSASLIAVLESAHVEVDLRQLGENLFEYAKRVFYPGFIGSADTLAYAARGVSVANVRYSDLVRDPIGAVVRIYSAFGKELRTDATNRMRNYLRDNPRNKYGAHEYTLDDFALNAELIRKQCAGYIAEFLEPERPPE